MGNKLQNGGIKMEIKTDMNGILNPVELMAEINKEKTKLKLIWFTSAILMISTVIFAVLKN